MVKRELKVYTMVNGQHNIVAVWQWSARAEWASYENICCIMD